MIPEITILFVAIFALFQVVITTLTGAAQIKNEVHFYDDGDLDLPGAYAHMATSRKPSP